MKPRRRQARSAARRIRRGKFVDAGESVSRPCLARGGARARGILEQYVEGPSGEPARLAA
jgi:hypothetical protein